MSRTERREDTRRRLVDAAIAIARSRGLGAITIEAVASEAGLTSGAIYSNFASKEELLVDVAKRLTVGAESTPLADAVDLPDLLRRGVGAVIAMADSRDDLALALEFYALTLRNSKLRRVVRAHRKAAAATARAQAWAEERGVVLDAPASTYAAVLDALSLGLAVHRAVDGKDGVTEEEIAWALGRFE